MGGSWRHYWGNRNGTPCWFSFQKKEIFAHFDSKLSRDSLGLLSVCEHPSQTWNWKSNIGSHWRFCDLLFHSDLLVPDPNDYRKAAIWRCGKLVAGRTKRVEVVFRWDDRRRSYRHVFGLFVPFLRKFGHSVGVLDQRCVNLLGWRCDSLSDPHFNPDYI